MSKIKVSAYLLDTNFKWCTKDISIDVSEYDPKSQEIWYRTQVPNHIYNELLDTAPEYTVDKGFTKTIKSISVNYLLTRIKELSDIIDENRKVDTFKRVKKIFIRYTHSQDHKRCEWTSGYMGERVGSNFQFFVGYEVMDKKCLPLGAEKTQENYYTLICHQKVSSTSTVTRNDTNFQEGTRLHPLYMHNSSDRKNFIENHSIVDWTQEREDFLNMILSKFKELHKYLDDFLGNLDNDKIQKLIDQNIKLLN